MSYEYFQTVKNAATMTSFSQLPSQTQQHYFSLTPQTSNTSIPIQAIENTNLNSYSGLPPYFSDNYIIGDANQLSVSQFSTRIKDDYQKCGDIPVIIKNGQYFTYQLGTGIEIPLDQFPITNCGGENPLYQMNRDTLRMSYLPEIEEKMRDNKKIESFSFLPINKSYPSLYPPTYITNYEKLNKYNNDLLKNPPQKQYNLFN
jgi:hypothetical protein